MNNSNFSYYQQFNKALDLRESDPDMALDLLTEIREEAIKGNSSYWRLLSEHWRVQIYLHYKRNYRDANRFAVETAVEARKPQYQNYQETICIQNDLVLVYSGIDPVGYATEIKEAIDFTIDQTNPNMNCHYCLNHRMIDYYLSMGEKEKARDQTAKYFAITQTQTHYRIQAYIKLCFFSSEDGAWSDVLELSRRGQEAARENDDESSWIELKSYEALALQKLGKHDEAASAYQLMKMRAAGLKMVYADDYYDNSVAYQESCGDLQTALLEREKHLETFRDAGCYYWECLARLDKIRLLRLLEQDANEEITKLEQIAQYLKFPTIIMSRLER